MKVYKCPKCGTIVELLELGHCTPTCCGEDMKEVKVGEVEAAHEKHIPVVTVNANNVHVEVGSVTHPMTEAHYIMWIAVETNKGVHRANLKPNDAPKADFVLAEGETIVKTYAYCNLHGLWAC